MLFKAESKNTNYLLLWVRQLHYAASRYLKIKNHRSSKLRIAVPRMIVCLWIHPEISVVLIGKTPLNFGNTLRYLRVVHINKCKYVLLCFRTHLHKAVLVSLQYFLPGLLACFCCSFPRSSLLRVLPGSHCTAKQSFRIAVTTLFRNAFWAYLEAF